MNQRKRLLNGNWMNTKPCSDQELKAMRDAVYSQTLTPESWEKVKDKWRENEVWLTDQYNKLKAWKP